MKNSTWAIIMALGIALSGYFIYRGISKYAEKDRCVTVKGLSEREVLANRVIWPMRVAVAGNDADGLYDELDAKVKRITSFFKQNKVEESQMNISSPDLTDNWEYNYEESIKKNKPRYVLELNITVTSDDVPAIIKLMNRQLELRKQGVDFTTADYSVQYEYVDLSSLKPEMVEEATKNARAVAEKFAEDAGCELGSIINATQGQFSIDEEYYKPQYKKIRVVTTIAYYLK